MRVILAIMMAVGVLAAGTIRPLHTVKTSSPVLDLAVRDGIVWGVDAAGELFALDRSGKRKDNVRLPAKTDAWGVSSPQMAVSVAVSPGGSTVGVAGEEGTIYLYRDKHLVKTPFATRTVIRKIAFVTETRIAVALLSNDVMVFDTATGKTVWSVSAGTSPLSDMALSADRSVAAVAGEAGIVTLIATANGRILGRYQGGNVDNIYKLDFQNGKVLTAGQDRRAILYGPGGRIAARFDALFLIYCAALSPSAKTAAIAMDEENGVTVVDTASRAVLAYAKGHNATLNRIVFLDEKRFVSCADENKIFYWELP